MDPFPYLFEYSPDVLKKKTKQKFITTRLKKKKIYWIKSSGDIDKDPFSWNIGIEKSMYIELC